MKNFYLLIAIVLLANNASAQCGTAVSSTNVRCRGACDGSITFSPSGGTSPYHLTVDGGAVISFASSYIQGGLCAGTHHYVLTDSLSSCTDSGDVTITEPTQLFATASSMTLACHGDSNGVSCVTPSGGIPPYRYIWAITNDTSVCISGLAASVYIVAVFDSNNCIISAVSTVDEPLLLILSVGVTSVTCNGGSDGTACAAAVGGIPPYNYSWITGDTTSCIAGLTAGIYTASVQDANGCITNMNNVTIAESAPLASVITGTNATCTGGGSDGSACVVVPGGTPPYTYSWFPTGDTTACTSGLSPGIAICFIFDANNCYDSVGVTISQSVLLNVTSTTNVSCNGGNDGDFCVSASGGVLPYLYSLDGGITNQASNCFTNLIAGSHTVTAVDSNGCSGNITISILEPSPISISFFLITNATCHGYADGEVCAVVNGGVMPYGYLWSTSDTFACISGLPAGQVSVAVWDATGCPAVIDSFIITEPQPLTTSISSISPSCGQCDGFTFSTVSGGTMGYTFLWTPGGITTPFMANVCPGTYILHVTDPHVCMDSASVTLVTQCDSVWPGDANSNGIADNYDVLSLGMMYGYTGPVRPGGNNSWTGQICPNWSDTLPNSVNGKHSDCDGNGIINDADTLPVFLNYGFLHARRSQQVYNASLPDLSLDAMVDTAGPGQLLRVKVHMGSAGVPVPSIYGLAFTLTFDPSLVDTTTAGFDYSASGLGIQGVDLLTFQYPLYSSGAIDVALTRTNHLNVLQMDSLVTVFEVVITDNVSTLNLLRFGISNVTAITHSGDVVALNVISDSVVIDPNFVGVPAANFENAISVFPSPARDHLNLVSPVEIERAELINELGEKIMMKNVHQKNFSLDLKGIKNGMYFLQLTTPSGLARKRICVLK